MAHAEAQQDMKKAAQAAEDVLTKIGSKSPPRGAETGEAGEGAHEARGGRQQAENNEGDKEKAPKEDTSLKKAEDDALLRLQEAKQEAQRAQRQLAEAERAAKAARLGKPAPQAEPRERRDSRPQGSEERWHPPPLPLDDSCVATTLRLFALCCLSTLCVLSLSATLLTCEPFHINRRDSIKNLLRPARADGSGYVPPHMRDGFVAKPAKMPASSTFEPRRSNPGVRPPPPRQPTNSVSPDPLPRPKPRPDKDLDGEWSPVPSTDAAKRTKQAAKEPREGASVKKDEISSSNAFAMLEDDEGSD